MWFIQIKTLAFMVGIVCIFFTKSLTYHFERSVGYHCFREFLKSAWILILYALNVKSKSSNFRLFKGCRFCLSLLSWKFQESNSSQTEPCHCLLGMFTTALNGWWRATLIPLCHPGCTFIQTRLPQGRLGWDKWSVSTSWSSPTTNWMTKAM